LDSDFAVTSTPARLSTRSKTTVLTQTETADLVRRAQQGDREAFTALVKGYLRAGYVVALSVVSRPADADDVAQDAFLKAFERLDSCREPEHFAAWFLQIVRHRAFNWLESRRLRDVSADGAKILEFSTTPAESAGMRQALLSALAALEPRQREVVLLHDLENWTHPEIAAALNISEVSSRQHLFRARQLMRAKLGATAPSEENHGP
jgi:RNA polymerase sigma-70 factor (ECF subfamily)